MYVANDPVFTEPPRQGEPPPSRLPQGPVHIGPARIDDDLGEIPVQEFPPYSAPPGAPPPEFLRPPQGTRPVPPPTGPQGYPMQPMSPQQPPPPPMGPAPTGDKPVKGKGVGVIVAVLAVILVFGALAVFLIFDLFGVRTALAGVIPALAPKEESSAVESLPAESSRPASSKPESSAPQESSLPEESSSPEPQIMGTDRYDVSLVIEPLFTDVYDFDEYGHAVVYDGAYWGVIDQEGTYLVPPAYDMIFSFSDDHAIVELDGYYGLIDRTGKEIVPPTMEDIYAYTQGLLPVFEGGYWGFMDLNGEMVIPFQYDDVYSFTEDYAAVFAGGNCFYINLDGTVASGYYQDAKPFSNGLAAVKLGGKWGYIDQNFRQVVPCLYDEDYSRSLPTDYYNGYALVKKGDYVVVLDELGNELTPEVTDAYSGDDGYWLLQDGSLYGLYDIEAGAYIITPQYIDMFQYRDGLASATPDDLNWYYVDLDNEKAFEGEFDYALSFRDGLAQVKLGDYWGVIDTQGNLVSDFQWSSLGNYRNGMLAVSQDGYWGFLKIEEK